ncbi:MAG: hypothetical protein FWH36_03090 [Lentimicrobiaceae bacterium]|nr:hypothetical protein [Lentimicrobiaceae bacterium]
MSKFFQKSIVLGVFLVNGFFVCSQTKIMVYNENTSQRENKVFTANLLKSFANPELDCEASDETKNINVLLKEKGYKKRKKGIPDSLIASVCERFEADYLVIFTLYLQKTTKNVKVSLINANTFSVEKSKMFTCNDLQNKTQVKEVTDAVAAFFLLEDVNLNAENETDTIAEPTKRDKQGNLNGHYISLGSGILSSGYYGGLGLAYEYRHWLFGANAAFGVSEYFEGYAINVGCKVYFSNKIPFVRNLYANVLPFCYFGQGRDFISGTYKAGDDYNIVRTSIYKLFPIFGGKILFGYSPVWRVGKKKKVSLGFNMDIGVDIGYKSDYKVRYKHRYSYFGYDYYGRERKNWYPLYWDFGFIVKF